MIWCLSQGLAIAPSSFLYCLFFLGGKKDTPEDGFGLGACNLDVFEREGFEALCLWQTKKAESSTVCHKQDSLMSNLYCQREAWVALLIILFHGTCSVLGT